METEKTIMSRVTTRSYHAEQIKELELNFVLNAAQMAPIAGADYSSTHLTVVQNQTLIKEIKANCMLKTSQGEDVDAFYGAPTIIFLSAHGLSDDNIEYCNIGCAIENMLLAATDLGLGSTYIWGCLRKLRNFPDTIKKLQIPDGYVIISAVALGYPNTVLKMREQKHKIQVNRI